MGKFFVSGKYGPQFEKWCEEQSQTSSDKLFIHWLSIVKSIVTVKRDKPRNDRRILQNHPGENDDEKEDEEEQEQDDGRVAKKRKGRKKLKVDKIPNKLLSRLDNWDNISMFEIDHNDLWRLFVPFRNKNVF